MEEPRIKEGRDIDDEHLPEEIEGEIEDD